MKIKVFGGMSRGWLVLEIQINDISYFYTESPGGEVYIDPELGDDAGLSRPLWLLDSVYTYEEVVRAIAEHEEDYERGEAVYAGDIWLMDMRERGLLPQKEEA